MPAPSATVYFENAAGRIWDHPAGYLRLHYHPGPRTATDFRALLTHAANALRRTGYGRLLVDQRQMLPFAPAEQQWMIGEWLPHTVETAGYRYGAVLLAHDVFARLAMNRVVLATRQLPHTYHHFDDEAAALAWLLAQA